MSSTIQSKFKTGSMIAASAAVLVLAGCATNSGMSHDGMSSGDKMVHCMGVNSCKGTSDCKTAENACKGQNACKGHGFLGMKASECEAKGGTPG